MATQGSGPDARSYTLQYNPQGYPSSITDPLSSVLGFEYDQAGRVMKRILSDGRQILYTYDSNGNVTSVTPPGRPSHSFVYNTVDLLAEYDPPAIGLPASSTQYSYNIDRQLTQILRPDGQTIAYGYDTGGRLSTVTSPDGATTYTYDPAKGYLSGITMPGGNSLTYTHDGLLLTGETWAGDVSGSVSWIYDNNFRVTGISINGGNTFSYQYDNDGLITKAGDLILTSSAQNGFLTGTTLGNVSDALTYNNFGQVSSYVAKYNLSGIFNQQFTYDKLGRIIQKVETVAGVTDTFIYAYDSTGNLSGTTKNGTPAASYSYDSNNNRLTGPSVVTTYSYDAQDRLITQSSGAGSKSYAFNSNGDLQSKTFGAETTQYTYDVFGNLKTVVLPNGNVVEYVVDGQDRRIGKKVNGAWVQKFLYLNPLKPVAELDGNNNIVSLFIYGTQTVSPDYMIKGGKTYRIISDYLKSPRLVVDVATGNVAQRMDYDEFGIVIQDTNPGFQPFGFAGGLYDHETGLVRFGARDYDSEAGRWTSKDPILFNGGQMNLYVYVSNDPINRLDPWGIRWLSQNGEWVWEADPIQDNETSESASRAARDAAAARRIASEAEAAQVAANKAARAAKAADAMKELLQKYDAQGRRIIKRGCGISAFWLNLFLMKVEEQKKLMAKVEDLMNQRRWFMNSYPEALENAGNYFSGAKTIKQGY